MARRDEVAAQVTKGVLIMTIGLIFLGDQWDVTPGWSIARLWPLVFVAGFLGANLGRWLVRQTAARCRVCGGRTYFDAGYAPGSRYPVQYRCVACGDVHRPGRHEGK